MLNVERRIHWEDQNGQDMEKVISKTVPLVLVKI